MQTANQNTPVRLTTSVLGNVDYRYGNDFPLIGADGINTSFDSINSPIGLPTTGLECHLVSTAGVVQVANVLTSWTDTLGSVFLPAGIVGYDNLPLYLSKPVLQFASTSKITHGGFGSQGFVYVVFFLHDISTGGDIYNNGNGIVFSFDSAAGKFNAYVDAISAISPAINTSYLALLVPSNGSVNIYDLNTGILIDTFQGSSNVGSDVTITIGNGSAVFISEVAIYSGDESADLPQALGYFIQRYVNFMILPLTFPTTSYPQTN